MKWWWNDGWTGEDMVNETVNETVMILWWYVAEMVLKWWWNGDEIIDEPVRIWSWNGEWNGDEMVMKWWMKLNEMVNGTVQWCYG